MTFESWWDKEHGSKDLDSAYIKIARSYAREAWKASRKNTRQAVMGYMDFLEDEYPADDWWEGLKAFVKDKGI